MKKSEILNSYLLYNNAMEGLLSDMKVNFRHEVKDIIGVNQSDIDQFSVEYIDNKTKIALFYEVTLPIVNQTMDLAEKNEQGHAKGIIATADLVSETYSDMKVVNKPYVDILSVIHMTTENELNALNNEKNILIDKAKKPVWKFFHPKINIALDNMSKAITEVDKINNSVINEKRKFESDEIISKVIKSFVDATEITYGIDGMKMAIGGK